MNLNTLVAKAEKSSFYRWLLSYQLNHMVPFNAAHKFKIQELNRQQLTVSLPYRKSNLNHLRGLHACALATLAEVTSGFLLVINLNPKKYRLILQRLEMDYHYQAKSQASATFQISENWYQERVVIPLQGAEKINLPVEVKIFDQEQNHVATGTAHWQVKDWQKVKTRVQ